MTVTADQPATSQLNQQNWKAHVSPYAQADTGRSLWQVANTLIPYFGLWVAMYFSLRVSYWLTLALAIPTAIFMTRLFIQFHDAGHLSFFPTRKANEVYGFISGVLVFTAYAHWRYSHNLHHATAGNLDRRGLGDVLTYTVEEWLEMPPLKRFGYRLYRHPLVMFGVGQIYMFLIDHRLVGKYKGHKASERSVVATNLTLLALITVVSLIMGYGETGVISLASFLTGLKTYALIQFPVIWIGGAAGVWLFYVQHQFEGVYWDRQEEWDFVRAAMDGSSYYKLPKFLQWASGNIGIHHIHHLSPKVPNYNLEPCMNATEMFQIEPITLKSSLKSLQYRLFDEANNRLVGFREAKQMAAEKLKATHATPAATTS